MGVPRYSVCTPKGELWDVVSDHRDRAEAIAALDVLTVPGAAVWDWAMPEIIAGGAA